MGARWAAKHLVRVNVPVLHALNPVDASVVGAECLVDVAALIVVLVHVRVEFAQAVPHRSSQEPLEDVAAHVVQIVPVVVENGPAVVGVHDLATRLGAAVLVEQGAKRRGA